MRGRQRVDLSRALALAAFIQWLGAGAVLPLLPEYLRARGSTDAAIGVVMASFFVAAVATQYGAGRLSDRFGRRRFLVIGLALYALGCVAFLGPGSFGIDVLGRALQGVGTGTVQVVAAAVLGERVPRERRGRSFGLLYGAQTAGLAVGPLAGTLVGVSHMSVLFAAAAGAQCLAALPVLLHVPKEPLRHVEGPARARHGQRQRVVVGVAVVAVGGGLLAGTYEATWTLLMVYRHAANWQLGLSWTVFAVPYVLCSVPAGWLADHFDRRLLAGGSLLVSAGFAATYPFLGDVSLMIGLASLEAVAGAMASPAAQSLLAEAAFGPELGRAQGSVATAQTTAMAAAAVLGGVLFAWAPWAPFVAAALTTGVAVASLPLIWASVPGRLAGVGPEDRPPLERVPVG